MKLVFLLDPVSAKGADKLSHEKHLSQATQSNRNVY